MEAIDKVNVIFSRENYKTKYITQYILGLGNDAYQIKRL